jgi:D-alanyl-D-alanine dipeptidase
MKAKNPSARLSQSKTEPETQPKDAGVRRRLRTPFGRPLLLEGEDGAACDELLARVSVAVNPVDALDEMFIADIVFLEWEVLRWGRLKWSLIRARAEQELREFLDNKLDYDAYSESFARRLTEILHDNLPDDQANSAQSLAYQCAQNQKDAVHKVNEILARAGLRLDPILDGAKWRVAEELTRAYFRGDSDAATSVHEFLTRAGTSIDVLLAAALNQTLDYVERVDRLTAVAESRRNASLREIDRRRPLLAETLRRSVQQIESDELEVVETTPRKERMRLDE